MKNRGLVQAQIGDGVSGIVRQRNLGRFVLLSIPIPGREQNPRHG